MREIIDIHEIQTSLLEVKQGIVNNVSTLIRKLLHIKEVKIHINATRELDMPARFYYAVLLDQDGINYGYIQIDNAEYLAMNDNDREKLGHISQMLAGQLRSLSLVDKPLREFDKTNKENSLYKCELDLAYSDLNTAHEELSDAYNLGVLLNRNLSRMREDINFFLEQAPIAVGVLRHRRLKIEVANSLILKLWGKNKSIVGKTLAEALPELAGQPYLDILDEVYTSGNRYVGRESPVALQINGVEEVVYFNFIYEPIKNKSKVTNSIMIIATDVTSMVTEKLAIKN